MRTLPVIILSLLQFITVPLVACVHPSVTSQVVLPHLEGAWRWVSSEGGMTGDTIFATEANNRVLTFERDSTFRMQHRSNPPVVGTYTVFLSEEYELGEVPIIRFSREIPMFSPDSEFIVRINGDTLILGSLWTDAPSHHFVRQGGQ